MIHKNCKEHREFFRLSQNGLNQTLNGKYGAKPPINRKSVAANVDRPTPTLVRVPSRRYQRMGIPDGSEGLFKLYILKYSNFKHCFSTKK